ncbi:hypothetical protein ACFS27_25185 [Promicromonospora vindobonensis]|uniref:SUKH-4 immunity protein of toxin-antitoxin system n=1 Tax=Promicromonospora vindobonensis TaxID=195748 RepID=A0ABW5VZD4_9MICO
MTASDDLLRRIEQEAALGEALVWPGDFEVDRREPVEPLALPTGIPLRPVAGCAAGGTYFLCGEAGSAARPVLYADSEGQATLIGRDLVEAITLVVVLPYWRDLAKGYSVGDLGAAVRADQPDFDAERDRLLDALGLAPASEEEVAARLLAVAASTAPHYVPEVPDDDDYEPYELLFERDTA